MYDIYIYKIYKYIKYNIQNTYYKYTFITCYIYIYSYKMKIYLIDLHTYKPISNMMASAQQGTKECFGSRLIIRVDNEGSHTVY